MDAEKKQTQPDKTELIKSISTLLDDTIAQVESMAKGEVSFSDLKLQSDENGDMPGEAGSKSDQFQSMKKEDEEEVNKEELEKEIPEELSEAKEEKDEDKEDKDDDEEAEKACKSEDEDPEFAKFLGYFQKAIEQGIFDIAKEASEEEAVEKSEEESKEEDLEKSEAKGEDDELKKALESRDAEITGLKKMVDGLTEAVDKMSRIPQVRRSISGLKPIRKSETDAEGDGAQQSLNKNEVLDKLLDAQKAGDKRVTQSLITQFELSANPELVKDILTGK